MTQWDITEIVSSMKIITKLISVIAITFTLTVSLLAQDLTIGSLDVLNNQHLINFVVDFSKGIYDNMSDKEMSKYEADSWTLEKQTVSMQFVKEVNEELKEVKVRLGEYDENEAKYTIVLEIIEVDEDGDTEARAFIFTNDDKNELVARIDDMESSGGHYGSFFNLMGDGFSHLGHSFGKFLENAFFWMNR